jgi:hypothetical protein
MNLDDIETPEKPDYSRANGSPMVLIDGKRERFSRTSNYAKPLDDESALTNWRIDTACFGVAGDKALQARYVSTKRDDRSSIKDLREAAIQAGRGSEAADIGTAIHAMSERFEDPDDDFNPPEPYLSALNAYMEQLELLGLKSIHFEVAMVTPEYRCAGTADRIYELTQPLVVPTGEILPAGTLVIGDLKTSKTLDYSKGAFATQLSLYAQGQMYDVMEDEFLDTPNINQDWGLIAWIPSNQEKGFCEMVWIDLQAGNEAAYLAHQVKEYRKRWRQAQLVTAEPHLTAEAVAEELDAEFVDDPAELAEFISARLKAIKGHDEEVFARVLRLWPEDTPQKKSDFKTVEQCEVVLSHIDKFEAELGLAFPEGDPRAKRPLQRGVASNTKEK